MDRETFNKCEDSLSPREREVFKLLLNGLFMRQEIADAMKPPKAKSYVDPSAVSHCLNRIYDKFRLVRVIPSTDKTGKISDPIIQKPGKREFLEFVYSVVPKRLSKKALENIKIYHEPKSTQAHDLKIDSPLSFNSSSYVTRKNIDERCFKLLRQPSVLIRIKAPKQLGKTSLLIRILQELKHTDCCTAYIDFGNFVDLFYSNSTDAYSKFIEKFIKEIQKQLSLKIEYEEVKNKFYSNADCTNDLEFILEEINSPLALVIDNVDYIFEKEEVYKSFAPLLRFWFDLTNIHDSWENLKIVISYSTEDYGRLDMNKSPFEGVGTTIVLDDLTENHVKTLASSYGMEQEFIEPVMDLVGGHTYLVRLAMYKMLNNDLTYQEIIENATTLSGIYREHLERHQETLEINKDLYTAFNKLISNNNPTTIKAKKIRHQLEGMGLIKMQGNLCKAKYKLYQIYFYEYFK